MRGLGSVTNFAVVSGCGKFGEEGDLVRPGTGWKVAEIKLFVLLFLFNLFFFFKSLLNSSLRWLRGEAGGAVAAGPRPGRPTWPPHV